MAKLNFLWALFLVFVFHCSEAQYVSTPLVKACFAELNVVEEDMKLLMEQATLPEDNEVIHNFGACFFRGMLSDDNKLLANKASVHAISEAVEAMAQLKPKLAELVANDLIKTCSNIEAPSKGVATARIINCIKKRLIELLS